MPTLDNLNHPTFQDLETYIDHGKSRGIGERVLANNTVAIRRGEDIAVRLHSTDILTYHPDGTVTYETGGWWSVTTKDRFNRYGPIGFGVYSDRGTWKLYHRGEEIARFYDGLRLNPETGEIVNPELSPDFERVDTRNDEMVKTIDRYVKRYDDETIRDLIARAIEEGTRGDCLGCQFGPDNPLGTSHYETHFEEGYVMASVMVNAYRLRGFADPGLVLQIDAERNPGEIRKTLRKFLRAQLVKPQ